MDSTNLQSTSIPCENWRDDMTTFDRARFIRQLAQALKHLSPGTSDDSILTAAKNFENSIYSRSVNRNQYVLAYSKKYGQIRYQIHMQNPTNVVPPGGAATDPPNAVPVSSSMAGQQTQSSTSPQVQMMHHQQTQNMSNNAPSPTQQMFMQSQNTTQPIITSQPPPPLTQNLISTNIVTTPQQQPQQPVPMNQSAAMQVTSQSYGSHTLITPSQQQQQQQLQVFLARQRALQHQQQQQTMTQNTAAAANMNTMNRPSMPTHSANHNHNHIGAPIQHINMARQNQSTNPMSQSTPGLAAQFKLQQEQLLQNQQLQLNACNPANQLQLQHIHQRQIQQLQQHQSRQLQQLTQQQLAALHIQQQSAQTNAFTQSQPVMTGIQQQQQSAQINILTQNQPVMTSMQQQQQFDSKPLLQQPQNTISIQQRAQAISMVRQLDESVRINKVQFQALENLTDQEKKAIWETVVQIRPLYEKISQLLPIFLALTSNSAGTRRLIVMKYMFEEQLNALPQNIYLMPLERLQLLRDQFNVCFAYVRNVVNGNAGPQPQPQPPGQQLNLLQKPQGQQLNLQRPQGQQQISHQTSPVSRAETSINTATSSPRIQHSSSNSPLTKRETIDSTLPPSKKQRATTTDQQPTMTKTDQQHQQQGLNSTTDIPATVNCSQLGNASAAIPDCAQVATNMNTPHSTLKNESTSTSTGLMTGATQQHQTLGTTSMIQNDLQSQVAQQVALSSGIPPAIVAILPAQALKCFWLLHQGSMNKINLLDEQKVQIRRMLDGFIRQAREQLGGKDHSNEQQQQQQQHDTPKMDQQQQLHMIDLTFSPPPITTNNSSAEKGIALGSSLSLQDLQQRMKYEPTSSTSAAPAVTGNETTNTTVPMPSTTNSPIVSTSIMQPAVLTTSPVSMNNSRPGMVSDATVTNPGLFSNDALKDVSTLMTNPPPLTEMNSTPLFVMDDFIIDGDNNNDNNNKAGMATQVTGQSYNMNKNNQTVLFSSSTSSSESPSSLVHVALKEGFKDETFCINELESNRLSTSSSLNNNGSSLCLDQSSNASSLSSTSLSSSELNDDLVKNNWYQIGMDKDSLGITDTIPGLDFDSDSFIGYDSGNRLSHPPLF